jgi:hypothetical protein
MDPSYAVYTVYATGSTRIGRRIIASLVDDHRTCRSDGIPKPARSDRRARRTPFLNSASRQAALSCVQSGLPQKEGELA